VWVVVVFEIEMVVLIGFNKWVVVVVVGFLKWGKGWWGS
jgi:hypothetical protein